MRISVFLRVALIAFVVQGCAGQAARELLTATSKPTDSTAIAARHEIYVATTRAKSDDQLEVFGGVRAPKTDFAAVDVTVPKIHQTGQIERRKGRVGDASKYFTAHNVTAYSESAFIKALREDLKRTNGRALVFIHGYNTAFDSAIYRMTQIVHDADYNGTPILFSWASGGKTVDYVYDNNSATAARDSLEGTLRLVSAAGAKRIDIIAHSMGNWVTMEALRQLAISKDPTLGGKLGDVVLASPDIDVDVFKAQMLRYGKPKKPFVLMLSDDDKALEISRFIAGDKPRLGGYKDAADIAQYGVNVVDLTQVKGDSLNHTKFAENPVLIKMLGDGLKRDDGLEGDDRQVTDRVNDLTQNFGKTLTSAAEIVITTPVNVLRIAVGG